MEIQNVLSLFTALIGKMENGKKEQIDFGGEGMFLYRQEIHIIWAIDCAPGIHCSEIARRFGVTRAVTAKTVRKLTSRGFLFKEQDPADKKCELLYLTEKGKQASAAHYKRHQEMDQVVLDYLEGLDDKELQVLSDFLSLANDMMEKHK